MAALHCAGDQHQMGSNLPCFRATYCRRPSARGMILAAAVLNGPVRVRSVVQSPAVTGWMQEAGNAGSKLWALRQVIGRLRDNNC